MTVRALLFWPHLVAGLLAGSLVLVMSATGVLLTYERQLIAWGDSHLRSTVPPAPAPRASVEGILAAHAQRAPDPQVTAVAVSADPSAPVTLTTSGGTILIDAYSGAVLGRGSQRIRSLMSRLRAWHRWLAVEGEGRPLARALTGWSNLLFAFLVLSGAYLWLPRTWSWRQVKAVAVFTRGTTGKARDFNWHNVIGIWSFIPLVIVVVSAVPISFPWANAAIYRAVGETPPGGRGGGGGGRGGGEGRERRQAATESSAVGVGGLDALLARAGRQVPGWRTISLRLPETAAAPVAFTIDRGDGGQPHLRSTLTLARATGEVVSFEDFSSFTPGRRIRTVMRFAHTGEVLGLAGQTIAGLVSAGSVVLVWTGCALAWRRLRAWNARRSSRSSHAAPSDRTSAVA